MTHQASSHATSPQSTKQHLIVVGGGTSGWLAAAAFGKLLGKAFDVSLIESESIGRIGVGEATIPPLRTFHRLLGINEAEMMRDIQATFKLGIEFSNWGDIGDRYIHSFGVNGKGCWACDFQHFWVAGLQKGIAHDPIGSYCRELIAAQEGRATGGEQSGFNYAFHLDAGLYAGFLKRFSQRHGVKHIEGTITDVHLHPQSGAIDSLTLQGGRNISGDIFIDCSGFSARLIQGALNTQLEPYGHYLPCDSAVAIQTENVGAPRPYTQSIAHAFGWQWRIPLQHRSGNGMVYCSRFVSDDEALHTLMNNLEGKAITEPRAFKYTTGRRQKAWVKNCIAVGLAAGFLEPLESTSIHLAMSAILRLLKLLPLKDMPAACVDEFNQQTKVEFERVRNFIILHYHATKREDSDFWRYCKNMEIPAELSHRIQLFKETGTIPLQEKELFQTDSWTQVMIGQHIIPERYHPIVEAMGDDELGRFLNGLKQHVRGEVDKIPLHQDFINQYCKSP
ncbi:tryptophan halogenase family protein [Alteromonas sp. a30]|uniref:tryptophan halogenase family protein n=1 Tax=Alteromonas sp. a30 TaxID=2730917 RepID=UPI00227F7CC8|nr:tryptophan halogenase family protein [Alteromonas sp. a30]MCY7294795.1 tryptophan 7-halogenase [Alteromonas sp. a30]